MARRYRVVRLITRLNIGGPAIHTILLTAGLDRSRFDCLLVTGAESPTEGNMLPLAKRVQDVANREMQNAIQKLGQAEQQTEIQPRDQDLRTIPFSTDANAPLSVSWAIR